MKRISRIGIIAPLISSHYEAPLVAALYRAATACQMTTILVRSMHQDPIYDLPLALGSADAWVVIQRAAPSLIRRLVESGRPTCAIGNDFGQPEISQVQCDNRGGVIAAMAHLYQKGHRNFAFIGGPRNVADMQERHSAFAEFIATTPDCRKVGCVLTSHFTYYNEGLRATAGLLEGNHRFSALICGNDSTARGAMAAIRAAGLRVPEDIAVVGFDNSPESRLEDDGLATIDQHLDVLAATAFDEVIHRITAPGRPATNRRCAADFLPRHSSGDADPGFISAAASTDEISSQHLIIEEIGRLNLQTRDSYLDAYFCRQGPHLRFAFYGHFSDALLQVEVQRIFVPEAMAVPQKASLRSMIEDIPVCAVAQKQSEPGDLISVMYSPDAHTNDQIVGVCIRHDQLRDAIAQEMTLAQLESLGQQLQILNMREKMVLAETTLQDTRNTLLETQKRAALSVAVAGMSHEINTPIGNSLLASSSLQADLVAIREKILAGSIGKSELLGALANCEQASAIVARNIARIGDLTTKFRRIFDTHDTIGAESFDLAILLRDLAGTLRPECTASGVGLIVTTETPVSLVSYPTVITEILTKLVRNALQHGLKETASGQIEISVLVAAASIDIAVSDNGTGIPPADLERVFDPFYTSSLGASAGLGLAMVKNLAGYPLHGQISATSISSGGTRITLSIPCTNPTTDKPKD